MLIRYRDQSGREGRFNPNAIYLIVDWIDWNEETNREETVGVYIHVGETQIRIRGMTQDRAEMLINRGEMLVSEPQPERRPIARRPGQPAQP